MMLRLYQTRPHLRGCRLLCSLTCCLVLFSGSIATASPISAKSARTAVGHWMSGRPTAHLGQRLKRSVKTVRTVRANDEDAFHVVSLEGGGFVIMSADDRIEPVIAFSDTGTLVESSENPLWVMLNLDVPKRLQAHKSGRVKPRSPHEARGRRGRSRRHAWKTPCAEWGDLLAAEQTTAAATDSLETADLSDVRRDALVKSTWSQSTAGSRNCYNYYTPNNYVCGCVATAGAQLMRYHCHPTASVTAQSFSCWVDETVTTKTMIGGTYDWSSMPLSPGYSTTDAQCAAIGKLCYDAGVATRMDWASGGSGACDGVLADSFKSVFGYACAKWYCGTITGDNLENAIYANLDAQCPVLLGIQTDDAGHEIVADGYGVSNGSIYTHLNLGWSGAYNAWYALPSVSAGGYDFTVLSSVVYNVFPSNAGELITGRVLDDDGNPISGATVTATYSYSTATATTDANGVYAIRAPSPWYGSQTWTITAKATGKTTASTTTTIAASSSTSIGEIGSGSYSYYLNGTIGNSWGNDLTLADAAGEGGEGGGDTGGTRTLQSVSVIGPSSLYRSTSATYVCAATYSDGSVIPVKGATWSVISNSKRNPGTASRNTYGTVASSTGVLTARSTTGTSVTLTATYAEGGTTKSGTMTVNITGSDPRPSNDAFAQATLISGTSGSWTTSSVSATDETGEPLPSFVPSAVATVWWAWTAPLDGVAHLDTSGSAFDTVLGVYTGTSLSGLTKVAENDNADETSVTSDLHFVCEKGQTYIFAVGGYCGAAGTVKLNLDTTPFAKGLVIMLK